MNVRKLPRCILEQNKNKQKKYNKAKKKKTKTEKKTKRIKKTKQKQTNKQNETKREKHCIPYSFQNYSAWLHGPVWNFPILHSLAART